MLSPSELAFLRTSLSQSPPIRPDLRHARQFRPLVAESAILPTANGSARVCFSDGTEAIVGVKAEVQKTAQSSSSWIELSIDGCDQDVSAILAETLQPPASLYLNERWHWRLFIDVLLLSQPLSYPLPLLSLTTHIALLDTRLPRRTSDQEDDPLFDDDWDAAVPLYNAKEKPPVTLLVMTVADNIIFDPNKDELAVADNVLAISVVRADDGMKVSAIRTVDPPSRMTPLGIPQTASTSQTQAVAEGEQQKMVDIQGANRDLEVEKEKGAVWSPPRGGLKRQMLMRILKMVTEKGGVGEEVMDGVAAIDS
ncbi:MAG: hypothetical protein Q9162_007582 [Coniocarpon cinnabarinum]